MEFVAIIAAPIITLSILVSSKRLDSPKGRKIAVAAILCAILCLVGAVLAK